jgi:hypothetical protein
MFGGAFLLTVAAALCWASSLLNAPAWRVPSLWLAVVGSLTTALGTFVYSRKQSPRFGAYAGAVFLAAAVFLVVFAFWDGTPRWIGIALLVALLPGIPWASRLK